MKMRPEHWKRPPRPQPKCSGPSSNEAGNINRRASLPGGPCKGSYSPLLPLLRGIVLWLNLTQKAVFLAEGGKLEKQRCEMKLFG